MKTILATWLWGALALAVPTGFQFSCQSADGTKLYFFLKGQGSKLLIEAPRARAREVLLSTPFANSLADERILTSWAATDPKAVTYLDRYRFATEIRTRYPMDGEEQFAELTLFIDEEWKRDYRCASGGVQTIVRAPTEQALDASDAAIILSQIQKLDNSGGLVGEAFLRIEAILRRWVILGWMNDAARLERFKKGVGPEVKYLHDSVVKQIKDRLPASRQDSFLKLMAALGQTGLSEVERYLYWLKLGTGGNYPAIRSLARLFLKSPLAKEADVRAYFQKEGKADFKKLGASDIKLIGMELDAAEKEFIEGLWSQATGAGTKAQEFGAVEKVAAQMNAAIIGVSEKDKYGSDNFGIGRLQKRMTEFMGSKFYADKEARALFTRLVAAEARKLNGATLKRLNDWLTPEEKVFLEELRK